MVERLLALASRAQAAEARVGELTEALNTAEGYLDITQKHLAKATKRRDDLEAQVALVPELVEALRLMRFEAFYAVSHALLRKVDTAIGRAVRA